MNTVQLFKSGFHYVTQSGETAETIIHIKEMKLVKTPKMSSIPTLLTNGKSIIGKMTIAVGYFGTAAALILDAQKSWDNLNTSSGIAKKGSPADTQQMYLDAVDLRVKLMILVLFVDVVAISNPDQTADIIAKAGLVQKKTPVRNTQDISVKAGPIPGSVIVRRKRVKGNMYLFQQNDDITNLKGWVTIASSTKSKIAVIGLTPIKQYWFQIALIKGSEQSDFTDPASIIVQ